MSFISASKEDALSSPASAAGRGDDVIWWGCCVCYQLYHCRCCSHSFDNTTRRPECRPRSCESNSHKDMLPRNLLRWTAHLENWHTSLPEPRSNHNSNHFQILACRPNKTGSQIDEVLSILDHRSFILCASHWAEWPHRLWPLNCKLSCCRCSMSA